MKKLLINQLSLFVRTIDRTGLVAEGWHSLQRDNVKPQAVYWLSRSSPDVHDVSMANILFEGSGTPDDITRVIRDWQFTPPAPGTEIDLKDRVGTDESGYEGWRGCVDDDHGVVGAWLPAEDTTAVTRILDFIAGHGSSTPVGLIEANAHGTRLIAAIDEPDPRVRHALFASLTAYIDACCGTVTAGELRLPALGDPRKFRLSIIPRWGDQGPA